MLDFLNQADVKDAPVLVVLIEDAPADYYVDGNDLPDQKFGFQLIAPPLGLIHIWQVAARARNFAALDLAKARFPNMDYVRFVYRGKEFPTSWHLTPAQGKMITQQLDPDHFPPVVDPATCTNPDKIKENDCAHAGDNGKSFGAVKSFLRGPKVAASHLKGPEMPLAEGPKKLKLTPGRGPGR